MKWEAYILEYQGEFAHIYPVVVVCSDVSENGLPVGETQVFFEGKLLPFSRIDANLMLGIAKRHGQPVEDPLRNFADSLQPEPRAALHQLLDAHDQQLRDKV